jgi:uncharacterized protein (DUF1330 family)
MTAYLVVEVEQLMDPDAMTEYSSNVPDLVARFGGKFLASGPVTVLEGSHVPQLLVLLEFESGQQMQDLYDSEEYAPYKALRQRSGSMNFLGVDGA